MNHSVAHFAKVVLIVEDDELLRLYAADMLQEAGFEVIKAENAADALSKMAERPDIHVLFTDVQMPGQLDGMALASKIHQLWPHVLLLITSGDAQPAMSDIRDYGDFLSKPYKGEEVVRKINNLERQAAARIQ